MSTMTPKACPLCHQFYEPCLECGRALPVTAERSAAPVEGDEAWEADLRGEVMLIVNEAIREGQVGASHIADQVLAAVKAIVAKAPDAGLVEIIRRMDKAVAGCCGCLDRPVEDATLRGDIDAALARHQQQEG